MISLKLNGYGLKMKKLLILCLALLLFACSKYDDKITGSWVDSSKNTVNISIDKDDKYHITAAGDAQTLQIASACGDKVLREKNMIFCYVQFNMPLITFNYNPQEDTMTLVIIPLGTQYLYTRKKAN